jgi:hypothetical protein
MHRDILKASSSMLTDHINQNKLDNRKSNLRECTPTQNQGNRPKPKHAKTSKFKGVIWCKIHECFVARGLRKNLGHFKNEIDAAKAYNRWATDYFKEFALLNPV